MIRSAPKTEPSRESDFWLIVAELERLKRILTSHGIKLVTEPHPIAKALLTPRTNRLLGRTRHTAKQYAAARQNMITLRQRRRLSAAIDNLVRRAA